MGGFCYFNDPSTKLWKTKQEYLTLKHVTSHVSKRKKERKKEVQGVRWQGWSHTCGVIFNELTGAAGTISQVWKTYPSLKREKNATFNINGLRICLQITEKTYKLLKYDRGLFLPPISEYMVLGWNADSRVHQGLRLLPAPPTSLLGFQIEDGLTVAAGCCNVNHHPQIPGKEERTL